MKLFLIVRAALIVGFFAVTAQSASALSCDADQGSAECDTAAQVFAIAAQGVLNDCAYSPVGPDPDGDAIISPFPVLAYP